MRNLFTAICLFVLLVSVSRLSSAIEPELPMIWPQLIKPGDTIMFVAPAGDLDPNRMARAKERLEQRGYRTKQREDIFAEEGYLAGNDERRTKELLQAFADPNVDAVFPGTGGYGTMRILDSLDYKLIRENPKLLIGFSDITALHIAINRHAGLVTFHSPVPMWGLGSKEYMKPFTEKYFFQAVESQSKRATDYLITTSGEEVPQPIAIGSGKARGRLTGGNLSLVAALVGTPYEMDTKDAILMIEDTREAPYRLDRMLCQLRLAGKLQTLRGAILGQFTKNYDREKDQLTEDKRFSVEGVLRQYFEPLGIPVLMNYPVGHHKMNATLPMGGLVEIDADAVTLRILAPQ